VVVSQALHITLGMKKTLLPFSGAFLLALAATSAEPKAAVQKSEYPQTGKETGAATAVLYGTSLMLPAGDELTGKITGALFDVYLKENEIRATEADIAAFNRAQAQMQEASLKEWKNEVQRLEKELKATTLTEADRTAKQKELGMYKRFVSSETEDKAVEKANPAEVQKAESALAEKFIVAWKLNKSLFTRYGGRVIFQQAGPEPLDAYRDFLKEREKRGDFKLLSEDARVKFWNYFTNDKMHTFLGEKDGREAMAEPFWLKAAEAKH
jgi:hypothetical protein